MERLLDYGWNKLDRQFTGERSRFHAIDLLLGAFTYYVNYSGDERVQFLISCPVGDQHDYWNG